MIVFQDLLTYHPIFIKSQFNTNKYTKSLLTDLIYNADTKFSDVGNGKGFSNSF